VHSKIFAHINWTINDFSHILIQDIKQSIFNRIELMSEEAKNSECNIDPCLIHEENVNRLTDFSLIYPQRIYCRESRRE
jgi:hypothetical protein